MTIAVEPPEDPPAVGGFLSGYGAMWIDALTLELRPRPCPVHSRRVVGRFLLVFRGVAVTAFDHRWRISSFSNAGNCVQARRDDATVQVRDSKDPSGAVLTFSRREWDAFLLGVRNGEFDLVGHVETRSA